MVLVLSETMIATFQCETLSIFECLVFLGPRYSKVVKKSRPKSGLAVFLVGNGQFCLSAYYYQEYS